MKITLKHKERTYEANLSQPVDISIAVGDVKCFYAPDLKLTPYESDGFIGSVKKGSCVNFFNVYFNPHGNGTHTESLGHITKKQESVSKCLTQYHHIAKLVSVPISELKNGDKVIDEKALELVCSGEVPDALIIRSLPNNRDKQTANYSGTNPPYLTTEAMEYIVSQGVKHLLLDLPSVDREEDDGLLENHKIYWNVEGGAAIDESRVFCTITELIFVPDEVEDGLYLLNIQIPTLHLDAAPSKPVLYQLQESQS